MLLPRVLPAQGRRRVHQTIWHPQLSIALKQLPILPFYISPDLIINYYKSGEDALFSTI